MSDPDLDELAAELSEFAAPDKATGRPPREERVIAGFEEIQRFVQQYGRVPEHGENRDLFERIYAVRLDRLRTLPDCVVLLEPLDHQGLFASVQHVPAAEVGVEELAAELSGPASAQDITLLRHVRPSAEKRAAEEIAQRKPCADFDAFQPLLERTQREISDGVRETRPVHKLDELKLTEIQKGEFFIVGGQLAYVADVGEGIRTLPYERRDSRLRVIYDNGTESDVLQRSFQRALYRDDAARLVTNPSAGPLFSDEASGEDQESGTIYVVRSKSELPAVAAHRDVLHKIGVTGRSNVATRFSSAKDDPTFLLAEVEVVATYDLYNVNRVKLENLIHRVFDRARLDISIKDRFGKTVVPREWFLVPLFIVDEAVRRIIDGSITQYVYDPEAVRLVRTEKGASATSGHAPLQS
jgi:hypothetical protein